MDLKKYPEIGYSKFPIWLTAFLLKRNFRRNASMKRYTAHTTSDGSPYESKYYYEQMLSTAQKIGLDMPEMKAMGNYLRA